MSGIKVRTFGRRLGAARALGDGITHHRGTDGDTARPIVNLSHGEQSTAFRGECPSCHAGIVAMSELAVNEPTTVAPAKGDVIRCAACGNHSAIRFVNERRRMKLESLEVATA